jgi:AcrR family transcriptional regulator
MPLNRFDRLAPERRQRLLSAAAREFSAEGFDKASLGRIADDAGVSKPAVYYYFEDKADLYATVVREAWSQLAPERDIDLDRLGPDTFWPALEAAHARTFERSRHEPWLVSVWKLAYHPPPEGIAGGALTDVFDEGQRFLRALIRRGQALGAVRTDLPEDLLIALFTGADNAADHWLVDHYDDFGSEAVLSLARAVSRSVRLILAPPDAPS